MIRLEPPQSEILVKGEIPTCGNTIMLAGQEGNSEIFFQGTWIWKLDILLKITNFLWLCLHGSVPVYDVLASRGINCDKLCPLCKCRDETITHRF